MGKSHANVVSFDKNVSYLLTSMNLYERNEETAIELTGQTLAPLLENCNFIVMEKTLTTSPWTTPMEHPKMDYT